ncbi:hypothetical protein Tco_0134011 [Tanacetum coccineum]
MWTIRALQEAQDYMPLTSGLIPFKDFERHNFLCRSLYGSLQSLSNFSQSTFSGFMDLFPGPDGSEFRNRNLQAILLPTALSVFETLSNSRLLEDFMDQ